MGVDVGGTFTDVVVAPPDGRAFVSKVTTTPVDAGEGVIAGIGAVLEQAQLDPATVTEIGCVIPG